MAIKRSVQRPSKESGSIVKSVEDAEAIIEALIEEGYFDIPWGVPRKRLLKEVVEVINNVKHSS